MQANNETQRYVRHFKHIDDASHPRDEKLPRVVSTLYGLGLESDPTNLESIALSW